jgi:GNAT superfamily N-acetyltransferase
MRDAAVHLSITPYERRHRHAVRELLFSNFRAHVHLDWHETDDWLMLDDLPIFIAWSGRRMVGMIAGGQPLNQATWVRLACVVDDSDADLVLHALWRELKRQLRARDVQMVALLAIRDWIVPHMEALGFRYLEDVITFNRPGLPIPPIGEDAPLIRVATPDDLPALARVDNTAFPPPWQLDMRELQQALRISASCTVAARAGAIIGYQLSTLYFDGAHLARLAVDPAAQGQGVARALLSDALLRFQARGVQTMSVNTQASNTRSQRLYVGCGFARNGYDLPVFTTSLMD